VQIAQVVARDNSRHEFKDQWRRAHLVGSRHFTSAAVVRAARTALTIPKRARVFREIQMIPVQISYGMFCVYTVMQQHPHGVTDCELNDLMVSNGHSPKFGSYYRTRRSELVALGFVVWTKKKRLNKWLNKEKVWAVTTVGRKWTVGKMRVPVHRPRVDLCGTRAGA
jgi:hypothetical protein